MKAGSSMTMPEFTRRVSHGLVQFVANHPEICMFKMESQSLSVVLRVYIAGVRVTVEFANGNIVFNLHTPMKIRDEILEYYRFGVGDSQPEEVLERFDNDLELLYAYISGDGGKNLCRSFVWPFQGMLEVK